MTWPQLQPPTTIVYPESDGKPMAESDLHRNLMLELIDGVDRRFQADPEFYVSGNLFIYYEEGHPEKAVAPDFFVVRGIPKGLRRVYKLWEEKKGPQVVIELTSPSTHLEDLGNKRAIYEQLQVQEYFIFDPEGLRFQPPFRGFALKQGALQPAPPASAAGGTIIYFSAVLGLELRGQGQSLRVVDPKTGTPLPTSRELERFLELEKKHAHTEKERADREKARASTEKERAEAEKERADAAERELSRLREELARLREN
ncbi:MAG: Uma2 family endonuclease [Planctomycetes bacterium]|nr:Uma2 family endonuclease [Planctomycetota bacterium]